MVGGDTSAGKSSLLSAISGLDFPSNSGLTTRCPTEVVLTRVGVCKTVVTLQHFDGMSKEQRDFSRELKPDRSDFRDAITEATNMLTAGKDRSYITPNGIKVKACGPDLCDLTLIDLPGLVSACGKDESSNLIADVRALIHTHMQSTRTVILCVLPANNDFHNSAILTMAKGCDPKGIRTLGIITKPDLIDRGAEQDVLDLAGNESAKLELGWHMVRLRSQQDSNEHKSRDDTERAEAAFFQVEPWNSLSKSDVGVHKLRERLQALLLQRIQAELPEVFEEVRKKRKRAEYELEKLGHPCDDAVKRRHAFSQAVGECSSLLDASSAGRYFGPFFEDASPKYINNLRAQLFKLEANLREAILKFHCMCIGNYAVGDDVIYVDERGQRLKAIITASAGTLDNQSFTIKFTSSQNTSSAPLPFSAQAPSPFFAPVGLFGGTPQIQTQQADLKTGVLAESLLPDRGQLLAMLSNMRGDTLPGFGSDVVFTQLVREKLVPWADWIAIHEKASVDLVRDLMVRLVSYVTRASLPSLQLYLSRHLGHLVEQQAAVLRPRLQELLETERERPYTQNHYYSDMLIKLRNKQLSQRISKLKDNQGNVKHDAVVAVLSSFGVGHHDIEEAAAVELEFRLAAYIKVASKRIVDQVPILVDTTFIKPILDSVRRLQNEVSDRQLENIIVENESIKVKRTKLMQDANILRSGVEVLEKALQA
eukprot:CAMPEP_0117510834 /NCGR_PEP_ID=MMETSP0784-20121206/28194_1 /TAXON_ID=39447 /ORGANISM="" /LENGTH=707 /DNA_ID=CAMNT_0005306483 /DNA_START=350 /DNA_END=2473 /DNA_ORIENTATION=-